MGQLIDLTGQTFDKWYVLGRDFMRKGKRAYWLCQCACGNPEIHSVSSDSLRRGRSNSCGKCNQYEMLGQRFGYLTVLEVDLTYPERESLVHKSGTIYFRVQCDCGIIFSVEGTKLRNGHTQSCGHAKSLGEQHIIDILKEQNIIFEKEKTFENLINPETNYKLRYDFYLPGYNRLIEFDGEQHYKYKTYISSWNNKENFEKTQQNDIIKNNYAKEHKISLIRIPYTQRDKITIETILGDKYEV